MPGWTERYLVEGASFREDLEPELCRLLGEVWGREKDPLRPCWIVIPAAPLARHLKLALLNAAVPLLNVEFLTLTALRERLAAELGVGKSIAREKQELLLRCLLGEARKNPELAPVLLEAIDAMRDAGHASGAIFDREADAYAKIAEDFERRTAEKSVQRLDREMVRRVQGLRARDMAIYGFDAGDWTSVWVLLAAAMSAERSAVFNRNAGGQVEGLELSWMAWWRDHFKADSMPCARGSNLRSARPPGLDGLSQRMFVPMREARAGIQPEKPLADAEDSVILLKHRCASAEARDVAALAAAWAGELGGRVGLIFAGPNPVSRLAVAHLERWKVPFEDQLGSPATDPAENAAIRVWFRMQQEGPHGVLLEELARHLGELVVDTPLRRLLGNSLEPVLKALEDARARTMSDDVRVMARAGDSIALSRFAEEWERTKWPESAGVQAMTECVSKSLDLLFGARAYELESGLIASLDDLGPLLGDRVIPRSEWVRYLSAVLGARERLRHGSAYSPIVISSLERARGQCFSAVIFCGLSEGIFPAAIKERPFQIDERARSFDASVSKLSPEDSVRRFGKWHGPVAHFTACRGLERQRFWDLINDAGMRVCFSTFGWDDLESHAEKEPSEFFDWAWWARYGFQTAANREIEVSRIESRSLEWHSRVSAWQPKAPVPHDLEKAAAATRRRFDPASPCDEWEFVFPSAEKWERRFEELPLSTTSAEKLLADPVAAWLKEVLGVQPPRDSSAIAVVPSRRGSFLHDVVGTAMRAGGRKDPGLADGMLYPMERAAEIRRAALEARMAHWRSAVGSWFGKVPLWWEIELSELRLTALGVLDFLAAGETTGTPFAAEWPLHGPFAGIHWTAVLDHVIHRSKDWIVTDLKTGGGSKAIELKPGKLLKNGEGFQLALYGLILAARFGLDPERVELKYHHPRLRGGGETVQASLAELQEAAETLLAYLRNAWVRGCFGHRTDRDKERPLAHLTIPDDVLREKWARTAQLKPWPWEASLGQSSEESEEEDDGGEDE